MMRGQLVETAGPRMDVHCSDNHLFAFKLLNQADKK